jgi:hypothetical protein
MALCVFDSHPVPCLQSIIPPLPHMRWFRLLTFELILDANLRVHGQRRLAQQSFQHSSEAYDKHLLSKIGKSNSPPRRASLVSGDLAPLRAAGPTHAKDARHTLQPLSVQDGSNSSFDAISRRVTSPGSAGISPGSRPGWRDCIDQRSPSVDSSAPSSAVDSDFCSRFREIGRGLVKGSRFCKDDPFSPMSRSSRGSYDQQMSAECESDSTIAETSALRQLNLRDGTPPHSGYRHPVGSNQQQGRKRRALSPPAEGMRDDKAATSGTNHRSDLHQRTGTGHTAYPRSPNARLHPSQSSVSSTSSRMRRLWAFRWLEAA